MIPGTEELFSLLQIKRHYDEQQYDVLVVDAAPTGETLRLLSAPESFKWAIGMLRGAERFLIWFAFDYRQPDSPTPADEPLWQALRRDWMLYAHRQHHMLVQALKQRSSFPAELPMTATATNISGHASTCPAVSRHSISSIAPLSP